MSGLTNEVLDGVVAAVRQVFAPVPVYDEPVPQGLPLPALAVRSVRPRQALFRGRRYERYELIEVIVFPPEGDEKRFLNAAFDRLFDALEIIRAGDVPIRGTDMEATTTEDGVGVFLVSYHSFLRRDDERLPMEELRHRVRTPP